MTASRVPETTAPPRKVLVVDDERDLADLAAELLALHGFETMVAYDAAAALALLRGGVTIDILFSDVMMPGMTGIVLAQEVGRLFPDIRIVLTSGYTPPQLLTDQGCHYPYVAKPYAIETVLTLLGT